MRRVRAIWDKEDMIVSIDQYHLQFYSNYLSWNAQNIQRMLCISIEWTGCSSICICV